MITLLCAMMIIVGFTLVLFLEKTIGLLSLNNMYRLNALVCTKILKSGLNVKGKYYDYNSNLLRSVCSRSKHSRGLFIHSPFYYSYDVSVWATSIEKADTLAILGLFRASWMENCLLGRRYRTAAIHGIERLAPRLSGGIHLTTLTTR